MNTPRPHDSDQIPATKSHSLLPLPSILRPLPSLIRPILDPTRHRLQPIANLSGARRRIDRVADALARCADDAPDYSR